MSLASGIYSLAPNWMSVFDRWDDLKRFQKEAIVYDLSFYNKTPIAEAYKWDPSYFDREHSNYCPECSWFSWSWSYVITGRNQEINLDKQILDLKGEQFCDHWCQRHNGHVQTKKSRKPKGRSAKPSV